MDGGLLTVLAVVEYIMATIGATMIVTHSKLFKSVRGWCKKKNKWLGYLISCNMCSGFWLGIIIYYLQKVQCLQFLIYAFIGSFCAYCAYLLLKPLIDKYD